MNFAAAYRQQVQADLDSGLHLTSPLPADRPTVSQPMPQTDGLDPAAAGGPSPMNSGMGPYGQPVSTDPLLDTPIQRGAPIPHVQGPDLSTTTLS